MKSLPTFTLDFKTNMPISGIKGGLWRDIFGLGSWTGPLWVSWAPALGWSLLKCKRKGSLDLLSHGNTCLYCEAQFRLGPPELKPELVC